MKLYIRQFPLDKEYYASTTKLSGMANSNPSYFNGTKILVGQSPKYYKTIKQIKIALSNCKFTYEVV